MIAKLMGLLDLLSGVYLLLLHFGFVSWRAAFGFAFYMIAKGYLFKADFLSLIDLLMGVYMILAMFGIKTFLAYVFFAYIVYKFFISFIPSQ